MTDIGQLERDYIQTRLDYDRAHQLSQQAHSNYKSAERELADGMIEMGDQGKNKAETPLRFHLRNTFSIACNKENEDDIKDWLHERYGDVELFTTQKVVKKTVEERIKLDIETENLDEFDVPDFMDLKNRKDLRCTGWKEYAAQVRNEKW